MEPHFELTYIPSETGVVSRLEQKIQKTETLQKEVESILKDHKITPTKVYINKVDEGKGKKDTMFENFNYKEYHGKVRGEQKKIFSKKVWKNDFDLYLLYGKERDGVLFRTLHTDFPEILKIGKNIYKRLLDSTAKQGAINWNRVTRTGTLID